MTILPDPGWVVLRGVSPLWGGSHCLEGSHMSPLFKVGDKADPNCYRPISILPYLSEVLET